MLKQGKKKKNKTGINLPKLFCRGQAHLLKALGSVIKKLSVLAVVKLGTISGAFLCTPDRAAEQVPRYGIVLSLMEP